MKTIRKIVSICLVLMLGFTLFPMESLASESYIKANKQEKSVLFESVKEKKDYQKWKVHFKDSNKTETLEWIKTNEREYYIAKGEGNTDIIEKKGNKVYVDNKVVTELTTGDELLKQVSPMASWKYIGTVKGSSAVNGLMVTTIAGVLASVLGGPVTGIITTMAAAIYSMSLDTVWHRKAQYYDKQDYRRIKNVLTTYKYNNYTGYIGHESYVFYGFPPY